MKPAAKKGDKVIGVDTHLVQGVPTPLPFKGELSSELSPDVELEDQAAATHDSVAKNDPPHVPPPGKSFDKPPKNSGTVMIPSRSVFINDKHAARAGDLVKTCNDPADAPTAAIVIGDGTVWIGE
ncbi:MAG TPA: PAAR domain-containing protein [Polyangiaceae bacterium]|jgi:uncharacterized Zn-binding protein involved in type VI secretion|nr:PAAR domain-containing protein [Polyangiaceae bacterium]